MYQEDVATLVYAHGTAIYRFCHKLAGNKPDADDLYQETFLKALEQCHKIDKENNPKAFLLSCTINIWKSNRRKYARRQRLAPITSLSEADCVADEYDIEEAVLSKLAGSVIRKSVDKLDDKYRIPLYLYYTLEMGIADISIALKIPPGTVKSRLHKARSLIKKRLEVSSNEVQQFGRSIVQKSPFIQA